MQIYSNELCSSWNTSTIYGISREKRQMPMPFAKSICKILQKLNIYELKQIDLENNWWTEVDFSQKCLLEYTKTQKKIVKISQPQKLWVCPFKKLAASLRTTITYATPSRWNVRIMMSLTSEKSFRKMMHEARLSKKLYRHLLWMTALQWLVSIYRYK